MSMKGIYYDAEFTGLHRNTTLVSIGMVSETGTFFYAEFTDYDKSQVDDWLEEHVISNLMMKDVEKIVYSISMSKYVDAPDSIIMKGNKNEVSSILLDWLKKESHESGSQLRFFTDCYAYDWVLLNDIISGFGVATNIPDYINYIPIDLSTCLFMRSIDPDISREDFAGDTSAILDVFNRLPVSTSGDPKHNSLWDALICRTCFNKLRGGLNNEES